MNTPAHSAPSRRPSALGPCALLVVAALGLGCSEEEAGGAAPAPGAVTPAEVVPEAPEPSEAPAAATTEGFIRVTIDGEPHRFEHLEAEANQVTRQATMLAAFDGPEKEHGVEILLTGWDVREVEYPATFAHDLRAAMRSGDVRAASRMPMLTLVDGEARDTMVFRDPPLRCTGFEGGTLRCTFEGEISLEGGGTKRLTDGELEVALRNDAMGADVVLDQAVGAGAP